MHQQSTSAEAIQFRDTLNELRKGPITLTSWRSLVRRTKKSLSAAEWESFHDALRLYATNREVHGYNLQHLESLHRPVMKVKAVNTGPAARQASSDECGSLDNELFLSEGAKVILRWNLCIDEGLVHGTMAKVYHIIWDDDVQDPFNTMPAMVLVEVDGYAGRATIPINGMNVIPILPRTHQWDHNGTVYTRTQIPLSLAFAITIHKSQGLTLDEAVVNLDTKRIQSSLTYVALSRVRQITSLAIEGVAAFDRFPRDSSLAVKMQQNDAGHRLGQPIPWT